MRRWPGTTPAANGSASSLPRPTTSWIALALADTNRMELRVFSNQGVEDGFRHAVLVARLDNLGKGASGAAVQNLKLMLGL